jgi:hypothetical protein
MNPSNRPRCWRRTTIPSPSATGTSTVRSSTLSRYRHVRQGRSAPRFKLIAVVTEPADSLGRWLVPKTLVMLEAVACTLVPLCRRANSKAIEKGNLTQINLVTTSSHDSWGFTTRISVFSHILATSTRAMVQVFKTFKSALGFPTRYESLPRFAYVSSF